jgi:hypothetical protein
VSTKAQCDVPLERKVQEDQEDACGIACLICRTGVQRKHDHQHCDNYYESGCPGHEHPSSGVDLVVEPGTEGVVDEA